MQAPPLRPQIDPPAPVREPESLPELRSPRRIRWIRRRRALARFWKEYRKSGMGMAGLIILVLFLAMALFAIFGDDAGVDPSRTFGPVLAPPSRDYPFGTNDLGISVLTLVVQGSKISLLVGLTATVLSMTIGAAVGVIAGYRGGGVDNLLMRVTDFGLVLPWLALAIVLASLIGQSLGAIILVIGVTSWPATARLVRAQVLSIRERPYIERAKALGGSNTHMIVRHVLPNAMPVILANTILTIAIAILSETALSFLGLGDPTKPSWGTILEDAFSAGATTLGAWWWIAAPGVCITLVVLAFTMCGFAMDEIINPRLKNR